MAGGIDWFRWHHGSVADQKFILIAKKSGASVAEVIAVWACLLEAASSSDDRGNFGAVDYEALDCALGMQEGRAQAIHEAMAARGVVTPGGDVAAWEKRQPKRERTDDNSTERSRAFREKQRQAEPCNATQRQETPRGEESREEETPSNLTVAPAFPLENRQAEPPVLALVEAPKPKPRQVPDCPHKQILELWAEVLPALPQHNVEMWTGARADHLRARWRETAASKGWESVPDGLTYFRRLFGYIGQSAFLTGRAKPINGKPPFVAELAWVVLPQSWAKVHEGKYHTEAA
jgi:hypothetical protein